MSYSQSESVTVSNGRIKSQIRILIVDSNSFNSQLLINQLKPETNVAVVAITNNERDTFIAIKKLMPNIVIIDFDIPEIDGYALIKKIDDNFPIIKTIIFTNQNQLGNINKALALGAKGFITKNSSMDEIKNVLYTVASDHSSDTKLQLPDSFAANQSSDTKLQLAESSNPFTESSIAQSNNSPDLEETAITPSETAISQYNNAESSSSAMVHSPGGLPAQIPEREDWSAATNELLDALPRTWTRSLLYCLIIGTAIIIPWSVLTKVDQTGTARGRLEPKDRVINLDAPVAARIEAINVKEGEAVKKGAILAELESEVVNSELEQLKDKRSGLLQRLSQLESMQNQAIIARDTKGDETTSRLLEKQSQLAQAQQNLDTLKALYESQKGEKLAQIEQAKQEITSVIAARKEAALTLKGAQEKSKRYETAYKEGVISEDRFFDIQQEAKGSQERLAQATSAVEQAKSRLKEQQSSYENLIKKSAAEIEQASLRVEEQQQGDQTLAASGKLEKLETEKQLQDLESQITATKTEIAQANRQIEASQFQLEERQLLAPADGIVFHIPARGKGAVVQPGERMIEIAPKNSALILKAQIPPTDSGFLKQGMPVKVKFDAYPFQDYGISEGELVSISPDSKVTETEQGKQESYELKVELDKSYVLDGDKQIELTPGQTATAEVVIRQRRLIDFFLDPFRKLQQDGVKL